MIKVINSTVNARFKFWKSLHDSKGIRKAGRYLLSGRKLIPEFLKTDNMETLLIQDPLEIEGLKFHKNLEVVQLSKPLFKELDISGTHFPMLVGIAPQFDKADLEKAPLGLEVVVALGDPLNLGAMLRSCEAFGVSKVILCEECANPFHPKVIKASAGSSLRLPLQLGPSIQNISGDILSLDSEGTDINQFDWPKDVRLLLGEEGPGVPWTLKRSSISIPINPKVESLNATVAASLALFSYRARHSS